MHRDPSANSLLRAALLTSVFVGSFLLPLESKAQTGWGVGGRVGPTIVQLEDPPEDNRRIVDFFFAAGLTGRYLFDLQPGNWSAGFELSLLVKDVPVAARDGVVTETKIAATFPLLAVLQHDFQYVSTRALGGVSTGFSRADFMTLCAGLGVEIPTGEAGIALDYIYQHHISTIQSADGGGETGVTHLVLLGLFF